MGFFIIRRMFYLQNRLINNLRMRWEAKVFRRDVKKIVDDYKELGVVEEKHDLRKIEKIEEHMAEKGGEAVREAYALFTNDMLALDHVARKLPDTQLYVKYIQRMKKKYRKNKEVVVKLEEVEKKLEKCIDEITASAMPELEQIYKKILQVIKGAETPDRENFMQQMNEFWRMDADKYFDYWLIRIEEKRELKDLSKVESESEKLADVIKDLQEKLEQGKISKVDDAMKYLDETEKKIFAHIESIVKYAKDAFLNGYKFAMRSLLALFTMINYLNRLYMTNKKLAKQHDIPIKTAQKMEEKIKEILFTERKDAKLEIQALHAVEHDLLVKK